MQLIEGKSLANQITTELKEEIARENLHLSLGIIFVGNNPSSEIYVKNKMRVCEEVGIKTYLKRFKEDAKEEDIIAQIEEFNASPNITGILIQSPLPNHFDEKKLMNLIKWEKDADGFHLMNMGALATNNEKIMAATPEGIIALLENANINIAGKHAVIVGRSNIVGRPLALALLNRDATVTVVHSKTINLKKYTQDADILIVAVGKAGFIKKEDIKEGAIIIDVGINRLDGHICGDVDFESVKDKVSFITPVPGGVGPMTIAMLLKNIVKLAKIRR